jgi:hypothetical protein
MDPDDSGPEDVNRRTMNATSTVRDMNSAFAVANPT